MIKTFAFLSLTLPAVPLGAAMAQDWALDGFDPVEIQSEGLAVPGRGDIVTLWRGESWHFSSEENRTAFEADPRAYLPAFDGLCPVSLADGQQIRGEPRHVVIEQQKIYLLRSEAAEREMRADPAGVLARAQAVWADLSR